MKKVCKKMCAEVIMIMKSSRASSNISYLTRPFTQSGWRDLNSRPLDLQIGPWSSVNHLSLISIG
jgi:hypothetical protein